MKSRGDSIAKLIDITKLKNDRFERSKRITWFDLDKIRKSRVLLVGAGANGNEVAKNIVLSGFSKITIVDMDTIERSNLNRCIFFSNLSAEKNENKADVVKDELLRIDPNSIIETHVCMIEDLGEDFIKDFDIVFGCLDHVGARIYINSH